MRILTPSKRRFSGDRGECARLGRDERPRPDRPLRKDGRRGGRRLRHGSARGGALPRSRGQHQDARRGYRLRRRGDQARIAGGGGRSHGNPPGERARGHSLAPRFSPEGAVAVGPAPRVGGGAWHRHRPEAAQPPLAAPRCGLRRRPPAPPLRAALRCLLRRHPLRALPIGRRLLGERAADAPVSDGRVGRAGRAGRALAAQAQAGGLRDSRADELSAPGRSPGPGHQHARQGDPPGMGLDRPHLLVARPRRRPHRGPGPLGGPHAQQGRLRARGAARDHLSGLPEGPPGSGSGPADRLGRGARPRRLGAQAGGPSPREGSRGGAARPGRRVPGVGGARRAPGGRTAAAADRGREPAGVGRLCGHGG